MEVLKHREKLSRLFRRLRTGAKGVLFCDYDGTLAPFCEDPGLARPYPWVISVLQDIAASDRNRLIIVTGRTVRQLLELLPLPGLEVWGSHGRERIGPNGVRWTWDPDPKAEQILDKIQSEFRQWETEIRVERKVGCLAVHWRGKPTAMVERIQQMLEDLRRKWDCHGILEVKPFHMGIELQAPGPNKGDVISTVLEEERGPALAACYLGDDRTDEDAFKALGDDGLSILVSATARPSLADLRLENEDEVRMFLERWRDARKGGSEDDK